MKVFVPKPRFQARKLLVWALTSFANPIWWTLHFFFSPDFNAVLFLIAPTTLFMLFSLLRLREEEVEDNQLSTFLMMWALATILIYTLLMPLFFGIAHFFADPSDVHSTGVSSDVLESLFGVIWFIVLAYIVGVFPAMISAFVCYVVIRFTLYTEAPASL